MTTGAGFGTAGGTSFNRPLSDNRDKAVFKDLYKDMKFGKLILISEKGLVEPS